MARLLKLLIIFWFALAQMLVGSHAAVAQSLVDVDPPLIEHEVVGLAESDIRQTFVATVVDDGELDSVTFYYRFAGESSFTQYLMSPLSSSSTFIAQIPTDPKLVSAIEYYIQARDISGNRTVRGYTFSPLVREIIPPEDTGAQVTRVAGSSETAEPKGGFKISKTVYILGGVFLLGLIAGFASGSNSSSSVPDGTPCTDEGCLVTLTVNRPF